MEYFKNPLFMITQYGAYDKLKIYKQDRLKELVAYANFKGGMRMTSLQIEKCIELGPLSVSFTTDCYPDIGSGILTLELLGCKPDHVILSRLLLSSVEFQT